MVIVRTIQKEKARHLPGFSWESAYGATLTLTFNETTIVVFTTRLPIMANLAENIKVEFFILNSPI